MPNHVHLLPFCNGGKQSQNTLIGNGKRFIGFETTERLRHQRDTITIHLLEQDVSEVKRRIGKKHELWQGTFDVKEYRTKNLPMQKPGYRHANPCVERWRLCEHNFQYPHSSAAFYEHGKRSNNLLKDLRVFLLLLMPTWEEEK